MAKMREIVIYHTNDMHGRLSTHDEGEQSIGIDKISKVVNLSKLKNKNTFWIDAGDFIHGTPRMTYGSIEELVKMINSTQLNVIVTGNHEYNIPVKDLRILSRNLNAYILSANTVDKETKYPVLLPYIIYDIDIFQNDYIGKSGNSNSSRLDNIRMGVFGLSTPETAYKSSPKNIESVEFLNPIEEAKKIVNMLQSTCDIIIGVTHLGLDGSSEFTSERLAEEVEGIDLIIDGHSHTVLPKGLKINNSVIVQTGSHGEYLGKVIIKLLENRQEEESIIDSLDIELLNEKQVSKIIKNPDKYIENKLIDIDEETNSKLNFKVTQLDRDLSGDRILVRREESELGNLVADAIRWKTGSDISVINGGTLRTGLDKGDILYKDLISVFPFKNSVQEVKILGKDIKLMLEHSIEFVPESFGGFLDISGMTFKFNSNNPVGKKVTEIEINGIKLDEDKEYRLSSSDFTLTGGDGYPMLAKLKIEKDFGAVEDVVAEYLNEVGLGDIEIGRITNLTN